MAQEMIAPGWIKVWRKLASDRMWLSERFTKGQAWVDLLLLAQGLDKTEYYDGQYAHYKAGTVYKSMRWLADRWHWNRRTVVSFLDNLVEANMIELTTTASIGTTIRIKNWEDYQSGKKTDQIMVSGVLAENPEKVHRGLVQKSGKSAPPKFEATEGIEGDFSWCTALLTAPQTAPQGAPQTAPKKEDKEEKEEKNLIYVHSEGVPATAPTPLLIGGGAEASQSDRERIPEQWRDDFDSYDAYWRWRNQ